MCSLGSEQCAGEQCAVLESSVLGRSMQCAEGQCYVLESCVQCAVLPGAVCSVLGSSVQCVGEQCAAWWRAVCSVVESRVQCDAERGAVCFEGRVQRAEGSSVQCAVCCVQCVGEQCAAW